MAAKKLKLSITLDAELTKRVDRLAKAAKSNRSKVIEDLVADALEQHETMLKAATDPVVMGAMMRAMSDPGVLRGIATAVRSDLTDEQLKLFTTAVETLGEKGRKLKK